MANLIKLIMVNLQELCPSPRGLKRPFKVQPTLKDLFHGEVVVYWLKHGQYIYICSQANQRLLCEELEC